MPQQFSNRTHQTVNCALPSLIIIATGYRACNRSRGTKTGPVVGGTTTGPVVGAMAGGVDCEVIAFILFSIRRDDGAIGFGNFGSALAKVEMGSISFFREQFCQYS